MASVATTAEQAYSLAAGNPEGFSAPQQVPICPFSPFICPFCAVNSQHAWGVAAGLTVYSGKTSSSGRHYKGATLVAALCQNCGEETVFSAGKVIVPAQSTAPHPVPDMPKDVLNDFEEAREIVGKSPRGAAALLRLVIQKLCAILGATKPDINAAIGELVAAGKINVALQQALDTVRVVGNEAVHPGTLDLNDDRQTATALFGLINFIIEKAITEPAQIGKLYQSLPAGKLAGIAQRDKPKDGA